MMPRPLQMTPDQLAMLVEFERLHAQWRHESEIADAIECTVYADGPQDELLLQHRLAADRLHQQAMQLLRARPI